MLVRLTRAPVLSWRPETQNSAFLRYPYMAASLQDPTSPVQRFSKVQNPALSASFPREQSVVPSYQKLKKTSDTNFIPLQSWSASRTSVA
ncbi:hypothetical protein TNCV_4280611 [Trichonephila clavipes]|nr:hypothetical protein TNCV_4280611 [Trichonephila clavipes]